MEVDQCWLEAKSCDRAALILLRIRNDITVPFHDAITDLLREIETTSRILRDLHDLCSIYSNRIPIVIYYINVILPCLSKTLRDMMIFIDNDQLLFMAQWTLMNERLEAEGGMKNVDRFVMYIEFLVQIVRLLSRSVLYDPTGLEVLRTRVLLLRAKRGFPAPPVPIQPHIAPNKPTYQDIEGRHWSEKVFEKHPTPGIGLKSRRHSRCYGPPMPIAILGHVPGSTVLFKLPFDKNQLSVIMFMHPQGLDITRLFCRSIDAFNNPMYACYGVHELCIKRSGACLQFRMWNAAAWSSNVWLALFFRTWEKLVLLHCTFVTLKARCPLTIGVHTDDYQINGEAKLFSGQIIDDEYEHMLAVMQDCRTGGLRLHASVWAGELRRCPVWTAFLNTAISDREFITRPRGSRHRVWLKNVDPYVFCQKYKKRHQRQQHGEWELRFVNSRAADEFEDLFRAASEEEGHPGGGGHGDGSQ
ncbi:hypothetical protein BJ878DRAFT_308741 [Calycina marina]|uniref:Uncharacterized protein n=1 Tax=Calycina marina TaxID=1763456 RepID=A0A9P7ZB48_9HELO|nr:hypothetical protein BJ878DRAFT_308741 [Calycina marina]